MLHIKEAIVKLTIVESWGRPKKLRNTLHRIFRKLGKIKNTVKTGLIVESWAK